MMAAYLAVDDATLSSTLGLDEDDLVECIEKLYEADGVPTYNLDKNWDMLHFALTRKSASTPIDGDPFSDAVVGAHAYDVEPFISSTQSEEIPPIITTLETVDFDSLRSHFTLTTLAKNHIYPPLAEFIPEDEGVLWQTIKSEYEGLFSFYWEANRFHQNVIVSIY